MLNIKDIYKQTFVAIKNDTKLLELLGVEYKDVSNEILIKNLRKQVSETTAPDDILNDYSTRLCIHELSGSVKGIIEEIGYLAIDIHISKDKNIASGILSEIVKRIIEIIDSKQRTKLGLSPLKVGIYGLTYNSRLLDEKSNNNGWEKYSIIFEYRYLI